MKIKLILLLAVFTIFSCKKEPEYNPVPSNNASSSKHNHVTSSDTNDAFSNDLHQVIVKEVVPSSKYLYLNVEENGESFWIAVIKQNVEVGNTYFYNRALLKTNFESKETGKFFDKIYLVTSLVSEDHAQKNSMKMQPEQMVKESATKALTTEVNGKSEVIEIAGSVKIADLVENPKKYEGKTIQISGKCFKTNPNIMDRNWIHLKDGSKDDYDLVITSAEFIPEGKVVTMKGVVTLNKDFGAGYRYDLILENGVIIK